MGNHISTPDFNKTTSTNAQGYTIALVSAAILSTTAIFIRYLTQTYQIPALILAFWRALFVSITLGIILSIKKSPQLRTSRTSIPFLVCFGIVLAAFNAIWTLSVEMNGAAIATVLAYTSGGFTAVLGRWFLKEKINWYKIGAVFLSFTGSFMAVDALNKARSNLNSIGILMGIASGLAYAIYSLMGRSAAQRGIKPWTTLLYTFGFGTLILFLINLLNLIQGIQFPRAVVIFREFLWLENQYRGWLILLLLAAGPTLAGYGLYNISLDRLPSSVANLILTTELVFTIIIAYLLLGERLETIQITGSIFILISVVIIRLSDKERMLAN